MADAAALLSMLRSSFGPVSLALGPPEEGRSELDGFHEEGVTDLSPALRDALLMPGATVELVGAPGRGGCSLALQCMAEALALQLTPASSSSSAAATSMTAKKAWLCAIDPGRMLHAPAVQSLGVPLERLLVIAPPLPALLRVAVRAVRSGVFCAVVVDATALSSLDDAAVAVRRLTLAAEASSSTVFFLTHELARRRQPLPTAVRARVEDGGVVIERHRFGVHAELPWQRPRSPVQRYWAPSLAGPAANAAP